MNKPMVTVGVLLYKDEKYLQFSLSSLLDQDYDGEIEFVFRDQSPDKEVYHYLKEAHPDFFKRAKIVTAENLMHSGGHNAIIREMKGEYYFCVSNDMLYPKDFVRKMVEAMEKKNAKVAGCKLMQWDYESMIKGDSEGSKTSKIDSLGIGITKSHHFYDVGQGMEEKEVKIPKKLLGPSAALAVYHKDALNAIGYKNKDGLTEYFDEELHYKNDVDLNYRLSWAGFPCLIVDSVKVYHDRQVGEKGTNHLSRLKAHHEKAEWAKANSLKGHLITVGKNYDRRFSPPIRLRTTLNNLIRFIYTLLLAPGSLRVYKEVSGMKKEIERKRKAIHKKVRPSEIEALMS
jgi:GT2 family glycosyltransferase